MLTKQQFNKVIKINEIINSRNLVLSHLEKIDKKIDKLLNGYVTPRKKAGRQRKSFVLKVGKPRRKKRKLTKSHLKAMAEGRRKSLKRKKQGRK